MGSQFRFRLLDCAISADELPPACLEHPIVAMVWLNMCSCDWTEGVQSQEHYFDDLGDYYKNVADAIESLPVSARGQTAWSKFVVRNLSHEERRNIFTAWARFGVGSCFPLFAGTFVSGSMGQHLNLQTISDDQPTLQQDPLTLALSHSNLITNLLSSISRYWHLVKPPIQTEFVHRAKDLLWPGGAPNPDLDRFQIGSVEFGVVALSQLVTWNGHDIFAEIRRRRLHSQLNKNFQKKQFWSKFDENAATDSAKI